MTKGDMTRERILLQAAQLFNQQGYAASSISDVMGATGLQKGGIYNHFGNKQELELAAFDYAFGLASQCFVKAVEGKVSAREQLLAVVEVFRDFTDDRPLPGGCPLLNTAIESDDTNPALLQRTRKGMDKWRGLIASIVRRGVATGEFRADVDAQSVATVLIATLEGAVMLSRLYSDPVHMKRVVEHLTETIEYQLQT